MIYKCFLLIGMFNKDDMIKSEYEIKEVIVFIKDL